ncbi:MAG: CHASE2 domain-containing protein [Verrucomicrobia bacterium]|nr:CHASE2 domain-containing protein [Verrucomicrobiota bacterium]
MSSPPSQPESPQPPRIEPPPPIPPDQASGWLGPLLRRGWTSRQTRGGALGLLAGFILLWAWSDTQEPITELWVAANGLLVLWAGFWALLHPRALWRERGTLVRWAFWPALLLTLLFRSTIEPVLAEVTGQWLPSGIIYGFSLFVVLPVLFVASLIVSAVGTALAAFQARRDLPQGSYVRLGIRAWWAVSLIASFLAFSGIFSTSASWITACLASIPAGTWMLHRWARAWGGQTLAQRVDSLLARWFVWQRASGKRIDLRGETLAFVGFLLAWMLSSLKLLAPLQASALLAAVQLLNAANPGRIQFNVAAAANEPKAASDSGEYRIQMSPPESTRGIVLLEWDNPTVRRATTTESEAAVHADLIRQLTALGVRRVVLPTPLVGTALVSPVEARVVPPQDSAEQERVRRDLPDLARTLEQSSNVVLLAPSRSVLNFDLFPTNRPSGVAGEGFNALQSSAREVGSTRFAPWQIAALPALPLRTDPGELPCGAVLLAGSLLGSTQWIASVPADGTIRVLDRSYPVLDAEPGRLLLDFVTATRQRDFARVSYSGVLNREAVYEPSAEGRGTWRSPEEFFRDKVVFLQPLRSMSVASPWGALEPMELTAYGVRTLLGSYFIHPAGQGIQAAWALLCALTVGRWVVRRNPIKASWRLLLVALAAYSVSILWLSGGTWLDPVFPSAAATLAFLLVTQLTFNLERSAKERNRFLLDRFVASEVVDELLAPAETRLGTGGQRERVTVLFADVRGFTQFAEGHSPEDVMTVVNAYLEVMTEALHQHGGILDKYTGDGLMALFRVDRGVGVAQAVRAALAMRDAVLALSADRSSGGDKSLQVGISMHVGEAVVGLVGNPERQVNFTALGHTVVVAARLQTQAGGGEVVVSQEVHEAAGPEFEMTPRPAVRVKGVSHPVVPYLVHRWNKLRAES